jgi:hypothetical protein
MYVKKGAFSVGPLYNAPAKKRSFVKGMRTARFAPVPFTNSLKWAQTAAK